MRPTLAAAMLLIALPTGAFAQASPSVAKPTQAPTATPGPTQNLRNITIRNRTDKDVVEAHATVSNKGDVLATEKGKIAPNEVATFRLDRNQCVQNLAVRFADNTTQATQTVANCQVQQFTVFPDHIAAD